MKIMTKEETKKIHDKLKGSSIFSWCVIDEVLERELEEKVNEKIIMDLCGLEFCKKCNWIVSLHDGAEYNDQNEILCLECYQFENKKV